MTKPIEDSANAAAIRAALDVPTNAALTAKYTKPTNGIPATDLDADPAGRLLLTATSAAERKQVLGLDQVNNTSDANKPVSNAQAAAIAAKMNATLPALQAVVDGGTAAQKAAFQSAVSGALWVQRAWGAGAPVLAPYTGAPTVTIGGATTSIAGGTVVAANSASLSYLGQTFAAFSTTYIYAASGRLTTVEFWTDAPQLDLSMLRYNSTAVLYVDGRVAATPFAFDSAGSAQFVNVNFGSPQVRRIELRGVNMPFGGLVLPDGYTAWQMPEYRRPVIFVTGDSYTFGNASGAPAWSWAGVMGEWLGMSVAVDGDGSTGWNSTGSNVPATRAAATTGCNALGRYSAGVTTPVTPAANIVALGYNDAPAIGTGSNAQTCAAAIDAFYAACTVKPLFVGPWTPAGGNANITTVRGIIKARADALGAKFVDAAGITSANWAAYNSGDNAHPNQAGHSYLGMIVASRVAAAMRS